MKRVGCAGILVKDTFCGPLPALPRAGELVSVPAMPVMAGGCAANVALDLAKQGIGVDLAGCVGNDSAADALLKAIEAGGVNCQRIRRRTEYPTSETVILLVAGEDRRYLHSFGANRAFGIADLPHDWVASLAVFYLGGLFAMPAIDDHELLDLLRFCRGEGVVTVLDVVVPSGFRATAALRSLLPHMDWFLPNETEAEVFTGEHDPQAALARLHDWGAANTRIIVTCGSSGALAAGGGQFWRCGAYRWPAVDPSGAGDAFASGVIVGILHGWEMPQILRYASIVGASATRAVGTTAGVFTFSEARDWMERDPVPVTSRSRESR